MTHKTLEQAARYSRAHRKRKRRTRIVSLLAAIVVFCTTYALILPAITQTRDVYCGFEEHIHSEACYKTLAKPLVCSPDGHVHTNECTDGKGLDICEFADVVAHTHNSDCYNGETLICRFPEIKLHTHSEDCYDGKTLVCKQPEIILHSHNDECKGENGMACGMTEVTEHIHSSECFPKIASERIIVCGKSEHTHKDECYVDKNADIESETDWSSTLPDKLSGVWQDDIIEIAKSQIGYAESSKNTVLGPDGLPRGYSRYGARYNDAYGDWGSMFVEFCLEHAKTDKGYFPTARDCADWIKALKTAGFFNAENTPSVGDVVFFRKAESVNPTKSAIIIEIIEDIDGNPVRIKAIEGDLNNRVQYSEYSLKDEIIYGYGSLSKAYTEYKKAQPREAVYADSEITVKATYPPAAGIPEGATLYVKKIDKSVDGYNGYYEEAYDKIDSANGQVTATEITDFKLYDICFKYNGEEIQPSYAVDIKLTLNTDAEGNSISVVHYAKEGTNLPEGQECSIDKDGKIKAEFATESFSLFAVVTTETSQRNIIYYSKFSVTSSNLSSLGGRTYAMVLNSNAMNVGSGNDLTPTEILVRGTDAVSGDDKLIRWTLERSGTSGSNYFICTTIDSVTYYLRYANSALSLVTDTASRTAFTAVRNGSNVGFRSGSSYITLTSTGVSTTSTATYLSLYTAPTGSFTVTFDGQIGLPTYYSSSNKKFTGAEKVTKSTDSNGYITLPTPDQTAVPGNYPMRLNGWYDIINRVYYDSSMFGKQIRVTNNTIFYPEWVAETYDIGQNVNVVKDQPDTSSFINTNVFDYNELFNMHSATYSESDKTWTFDADSELGFIFFDYLTAGNIGNINNKNVSVGGVTVNEEKTNGKRGSSTNFPGTITPGIANDARLNALFGDDPVPGRLSLGEADWLYSFDKETGYYYYNSAKNAASYNQSEQRFYVYDYYVNIDSNNSLHDFLPFNYGQTTYAEKDNEANYWFGMKSEIKFYLPNDSGSNKNQAINGDDMQFRFSGDDDVWIFIDGQLALDLGGVHDVVYGDINFSTGEVRTGQATSSTNIANNTADTQADMPGVETGTAGVTTSKLPMTLKGGEEHTLTVYYLERGSSLSNCAVYFNLSPLHQLSITKTDREGNNQLEGAEFCVYSNPECTTPATLYTMLDNGTLEEIPNSKFSTDATGHATCWGLFAGQTYYVKETKPPTGYPAMDDYVMQFNLDTEGHSTFIALDSNGQEWKFGEYFYRGGTNHLIEAHVYNDAYIGGDKKLYVEKTWAAGSNLPEEITVQLFANGVDTGRTMTLNAENDWKGFFYELPETDENGNEIVYTVKEIPIDGFGAEYSEAVGELDGGIKEIPGYLETTISTALEDGSYFQIIGETRTWAVSMTDENTVAPKIPSDSDDSQLWKAISTGTRFLLQNKAYPNKYFQVNSSGVSVTTNSTDNSVKFQYSYSSSRRRLRAANNYYLRDGTKTTIDGSGSNYRTSTISSSNYTLYKWVEPTYVQGTVDVPGWNIHNTPWSEHLSIPINKSWASSVPDSMKEAITLELYKVTAGFESQPEFIDSIVVNSTNGWKGSFEGLERPEEGSYYCIIENTDSFAPTYSGETVMISVDGRVFTAAKVDIGTDGNATEIEISNSILIILPDTGGNGVGVYITFGSILMITAFLAFLRQRRKKEVN